MVGSNDVAVRLNRNECYEVLRRNAFGRLAVAVGGDPMILPVNYVTEGSDLYFVTAEGSKLAALTINSSVAFEVDEIADGEALSVVVQGKAYEISGEGQLEQVQALTLRPWLDTRKTHYVRIIPEQITGRLFHLNDNAPQ